MHIADYFKKIPMNKVIVIAGALGMILIMVSSFIPEDEENSDTEKTSYSYSDYLSETENRLGDFLESMEGVGNVKIMITLEGGEFYIYAREGKTSVSESKTETDENYVMSGREKTPVLETVNNPEIKGAVIACEGASDPAVKQNIYNAVSKALGIPTANIYVTELK